MSLVLKIYYCSAFMGQHIATLVTYITNIHDVLKYVNVTNSKVILY